MSGLKGPLPLVAVLACLLAQGGAWSGPGNQPGAFDYYVLVLGWTPSYCRGEGRDRRDPLCDTSKSQVFLLHGLWPQYEKGWPVDCHTAKHPWVPEQVIEEMRDIMPSKNLVIHEYRTHGTCSGLNPARYFGAARALYERVTVPPGFLAADADRLTSPEEIERAFLGANPWLKPDMISVSCRGANLLDIRVCFGRDLVPRSCGINEDQKRLCSAPRISVPLSAQH